ncbi:MAG: DUF4339 domain-containing protein [Gammaproteobacteria bacterium]|nr:DUF4339 domain-containing protein [Gammaproteobacteria bacterium]
MEHKDYRQVDAFVNDGSADWYYENRGQRVGPVKAKDISELVESGKLDADTLVWTAGMHHWDNLRNTSLINHISKVSPPPLAPEAVNDTFAWLIATAPLWGLLVEGFIGGLIYSGNTPSYLLEYRVAQAIQDGEFWWLYLIIYLILLAFDENRLNKAGCKLNAFWIVFVPAYLYMRARVCKQSQLLTIINVVLLIIVTFF